MPLAETNTAGLLYRIRAEYDSSGSDKAKKDIGKDLPDAAKKGQTGLDDMAGSADGAATSAATLGLQSTIVAGAILAAAAAAVTAAQALFALAQNAAESIGELNELNDTTGLGVERLSALRFAAESAGANFQNIGGAVETFTSLLREAAAGSDDAREKLQRFGLDPKEALNDLEGSLQTVFEKINNLENPLQRAAAAELIFGSNGREMVKVIQDAQGDFSVLTERAREAGAVIDEEGARAARQFSAELNRANAVIGATVVNIGSRLIPSFRLLFGELSKLIIDSRGELTQFAKLMSDFLRGTAILVAFVRGALADPGVALTNPALILATAISEVQKAQREIRNENLQGGSRADQSTPNLDIPSKDAERAARDARRRREQALRDELRSRNRLIQQQEKRAQVAYETTQQVLENSYEAGTLSSEQFLESSANNLAGYIKQLRTLALEERKLNDEQAKNDTDRQANREQLFATLQSLLNKQREIEKDFAKEVATTEKRRTQERAAEESKRAKDTLALESGLASLRRENAATRKQQLQDDLELLDRLIDGEKTRLEIETRRTAILREIEDIRAQERRDELEAAAAGANAPSVRLRALEALQQFEIEAAQRKRDRELEDLEREKLYELERIAGKENEEELKFQIEELYRERRLLSEEQFQERLREIKAKYGNDANSITKDFQAAAEAFQSFGDIAAQGLSILTRVISSVADGVGQMVQQWVLYGKTSGDVLKKVLAQTLATIAAEAAVRAIYATAWGFLMLAQFNFGAAALAFKSAAIWGAISVGTAIAGRAFAGDSFRNEAAGGSATGAGSGVALPAGAQQGGFIDISRNRPSPAPGNALVIRDRTNGGLFSQLFRSELQDNAETRNLIRSVANE